MDIPDATTEKLKLVEEDIYCGFKPTEYNLAYRTVDQWVHSTDRAVNRAELQVLANIRTRRTYPDLADWDDPDKDYRNVTSSVDSAVVHEICTLPRKSATVQASTKKMICDLVTMGYLNGESLKGTNCNCPTGNKLH